ncbi:biopolymer transporter ExbD [Spongiibacter sp. KMU-166]|uniref:Biopolymer transporter ExbD n=1 Tax=Spongiibacter thalassae TaxID=2721624 RepID=A0ABX1GFV8_9GAMM|nr:biopolymer transporter ExbD [Spongiibacter thalassae]NKI17377.1 biopolymer transporter ExbD [Spongiibacter thalassae]
MGHIHQPNQVDFTGSDDTTEDQARRSLYSRRRERRRRRKQQCELNIVSLIDIFAVIVFFLLIGSSVSASRLHALKLDIPSAAPPIPPPGDERPLQLRVVLHSDGIVLSSREGQLASFANSGNDGDTASLTQHLMVLKQQHPDEERVSLLAAANIPYARIVAVMDAIRSHRENGVDQPLFPLIALGDAPVTPRSPQP